MRVIHSREDEQAVTPLDFPPAALAILATATGAISRNRKFVDSLLEGDGFEPSVPVRENHASFMFDRYRRPSAGVRNPRGPTAGGSDSSGYG